MIDKQIQFDKVLLSFSINAYTWYQYTRFGPVFQEISKNLSYAQHKWKRHNAQNLTGCGPAKPTSRQKRFHKRNQFQKKEG